MVITQVTQVFLLRKSHIFVLYFLPQKKTFQRGDKKMVQNLKANKNCQYHAISNKLLPHFETTNIYFLGIFFNGLNLFSIYAFRQIQISVLKRM